MAITPAQFLRIHVLGGSQTKLAGKLGISQERISVIESGHGIYDERCRVIIRALAKAKGRKLLESWFDHVPLKREAMVTKSALTART